MGKNLYQKIYEDRQQKNKLFAILIDPDKASPKNLDLILNNSIQAKPDLFLVGGSLLTEDGLPDCIKRIKEKSDIPVVLFPGSMQQINKNADALLFLSLISGRNPDLLIGHHVISAPILKKSGLEIISTGYILVESGSPTTVSYISNTTPIPGNKNEIAVCTAIAGELLGFKLIYMDGGSGAKTPISCSMIKAVSSNINIPLVVGGGINTPEKAMENCIAGADIIVVGNALEREPALMHEISDAIHNVKLEC